MRHARSSTYTAITVVLLCAQGGFGPTTAYGSGVPLSIAYVTSANGGSLIFQAGPGEANDLTISPGVAGTVIIDDTYPVTTGAGCSQVSPSDDTKVQCAVTGVPGADIYGNDGNDYIDVTGLTWQFGIYLTIYGGAGNDFIIVNGSTSTTDDTLSYGGAGDDVLIDSPPADGSAQWMSGDDGNDTLTVTGTSSFDTIMVGGAGADTFTGPGDVSYGDDQTGVTVTIDGVANDGEPGEGDNVKPGVTEIDGPAYPDMINAWSNTRGTDLFAGTDSILIGSPYDDELSADQGSIMQAGPGNDTCLIGDNPVSDYYITNCEHILP